MKNNLYIDFHVLQTVPPSCVNRDDVGSPKTAVYGGVRRARVSSQAWKKAIRDEFKRIFDKDENRGYRTRNSVKVISDRMRSIDPKLKEKDTKDWAKKALKDVNAISDNDSKNNVLFFMSDYQINEFAKLIIKINTQELEKGVKKKTLENAITEHPSIDIMLFGRMAASNPNLNIDATCQVAHAISTHEVYNEYDYYTAVDDYPDQEKANAGAGHIGTTEFNSSTLYRYATINLRELKDLAFEEKLEAQDIVKTVAGFGKAFITSMPTGMQNSFANRTPQDLIYVTIRKDQPVNLCGAFEAPIKSKSGGYVRQSIERLDQYAKEVYADFVDEPVKSWQCGGKDIADLGAIVKSSQIDTLLAKTVQDYIDENDEDA